MNTKRPGYWLRLVHKLHRILGTVLGVLMAVWFVSGMVMLFTSYPRYDDSERLAHATVLGPYTEHALSELARWLESGGSARGERAQLSVIEGTPTWTWSESGVRRAVRGDTGADITPLTAARARAEVEHRLGVRASRVSAVPVADQWTVGRVRPELFPLFVVELNDATDSHIYISGRSGEIVQDTTLRERVLTWLGAIPHWIYPAALRRHRELWRSSVLWLSGIGLALSISGLIAGTHVAWRTRAVPQDKRTVQNSYLRWHQQLGLCFGVLATTWLFSGALSLSPLHWSGSGPSPESLEALYGRPSDATAAVWQLPAAIQQCQRELPVLAIELSTFAGRPLLLCRSAQDHRLIYLDEAQLTSQRFVTQVQLSAAAERIAGPGAPGWSWHAAPDAYYYQTHSGPPLALPYVKLSLSDDQQSTYYVDPATLRALEHMTSKKRLERWLYRGLHCWDFAWLYTRPVLWQVVMVTAMLLGVALTALGVALPLRRSYRRWQRKRMRSALMPIAALGVQWMLPGSVRAMHLSDGVLPAASCVGWSGLALVFVGWAFRRFDEAQLRDPQLRPLVAMIGAAVFAISCMPVPVPFIGTCSHPCGTGLAAIFVGPLLTILLTAVALILQALFLAHGGITTLGADIVSMGVAGGLAGYWVFHGLRRVGIGLFAAAFVAGVLSDWATYATTALEISVGLHGSTSIGALFGRVVLAFAPTQLPLGLLEGVLTAGALRWVHKRRPELLTRLRVIQGVQP